MSTILHLGQHFDNVSTEENRKQKQNKQKKQQQLIKRGRMTYRCQWLNSDNRNQHNFYPVNLIFTFWFVMQIHKCTLWELSHLHAYTLDSFCWNAPLLRSNFLFLFFHLKFLILAVVKCSSTDWWLCICCMPHRVNCFQARNDRAVSMNAFSIIITFSMW